MLRIIFLNTWGGCLWNDGLEMFYNNEAPDTDIFCLQEVNRCHDPSISQLIVTKGSIPPRPLQVNQYGRLRSMFPHHDGYYAAHFSRALHDSNPVDDHVEYGNAMFVRPDANLEIAGHRSGIIYRHFGQLNDGLPAARSMQAIIVRQGNTAYVVAHFHGLWNGQGKKDCHERHLQTIRINKFLAEVCDQCREDTGLEPRIVLGGDFNLTTDTMAFNGLMSGPAFNNGRSGRAVNLNAVYGVRDTRTRYYPKDKPTREADFVLVSNNVRVHSFEAADQPEVSDHRPLFLECE